MAPARIHPTALVESETIGPGTRIWAFCHILAGAIIGSDCNVGDHCYVESGVTIGDEVVIKNGVAVWSGVTIADRVFVGPNVAFTNDRSPRAKIYRSSPGATLICEGASLGANATVICGTTVGRYALVGAGAVVTRDVPEFGLALGNPARVAGYVCRCATRLSFIDGRAECACGRVFGLKNTRVEEIV